MVIFRELQPSDLHAHIRYIVESQTVSHGAMIIMDQPPIEIPILRFTYKSLTDRIGLLFRTSSVGRTRLKKLVEYLDSQSQPMKIRKSTKLKLISQCTPYWPISETTYPAKAVHVLQAMCQIAERPWPVEFSIYYENHKMTNLLPGTPDRGRAGNAGYLLGRAVGKIMRRQ